jgi:tetratricopeptide (TPR) repeat protein
MGRIEKTVFISYRRTNLPWALAIYQNLTHHDYDVFFDYQSINSGDFEKIIIENIRARAHFIVILTPSALERCESPDDWLRREIETALDNQRNIVPLMMEGFSFGSQSISKYLTGKMSLLKKYNGLNVPADYFEEAMERLREKYLNIALDAILHPLSNTVSQAVKEQQIAANRATKVKSKELSAQEWFEKGLKLDDDSDEEINCYSKAIELLPDFSKAYYNRGVVRAAKDDLHGAINDFTEVIRLQPKDSESYYSRGLAKADKGDLDAALKDYNESVRLNPKFADAYYKRGNLFCEKADFAAAIKDYSEAIRLNPAFSEAFNNRGLLRYDKGDLDAAIKDYNEAIRIEPDIADTYYNRALVWEKKDAYSKAIADYQKYLDLGGGIKGGDQRKVEGFIRTLKKKIR